MFRGSAWEYNEERGQFYLHQFVAGQPDLNFRNPLVVQEMLNVLSFWLDLGVDGFRMDAVAHIWEDGEFKDEPVSYDSGCEGSTRKPGGFILGCWKARLSNRMIDECNSERF